MLALPLRPQSSHWTACLSSGRHSGCDILIGPGDGPWPSGDVWVLSRVRSKAPEFSHQTERASVDGAFGYEDVRS